MREGTTTDTKNFSSIHKGLYQKMEDLSKKIYQRYGWSRKSKKTQQDIFCALKGLYGASNDEIRKDCKNSDREGGADQICDLVEKSGL